MYCLLFPCILIGTGIPKVDILRRDGGPGRAVADRGVGVHMATVSGSKYQADVAAMAVTLQLLVPSRPSGGRPLLRHFQCIGPPMAMAAGGDAGSSNCGVGYSIVGLRWSGCTDRYYSRVVMDGMNLSHVGRTDA